MLLENQSYPEDVRVRNEAEALVRAGWAVTVLAPRGDAQSARATLAGVSVRRFRLPMSSGGVAAFVLEYAVAHVQLFALALLELARGTRVVHLHNPPDTLFPVARLVRWLGGHAVYDHHDLSPELFVSKFGPSPVARLLAAAQRASFRTASEAIVTNESQREVALAQAGVDPRNVTVVRNGPTRRTLGESAPSRTGPLADPRLVFVGELASQDGVMALPALLSHPRLSGALLTVVGDGPDRDRLGRAFEAAGVADRVRFTGWVPHAEVPALIAEADVCLDPAPCNALNHRSTMIKIGEYLAAGRPVVAHDLVETRRTADDAALYAPCGDTTRLAELVAELADDGDRRAWLERRARARAHELVWEHSERALLQVYARLGDRAALRRGR